MTDRRQQILDAALPVFVAKGYSGATIADIRKASGATTGSIYHFFNGKPGIAIALWRDANTIWRARSDAGRQQALSAENLIQSSVRGLLEWATENRSMFLFFEELRIRALSDSDLSPILEDTIETHVAAAELYRGWIADGSVKDMEWPLASALMMGPAYDYLRKYQDGSDHRVAIEILVEHAWSAVKSST